MENSNGVDAPSRERECVGALVSLSLGLIVLGWIALIVGIAVGIFAARLSFIACALIGVVSWLTLSFSGVIVRGFSYVVDAAIIYRSKNTPEKGE